MFPNRSASSPGSRFAALASVVVGPDRERAVPSLLCAVAVVATLALPVAVTLDSTLVLNVGPLHAGPTDALVGLLTLSWLIGAAWSERLNALSAVAPGQVVATVRAAFRRERAVALLFSGLTLYLAVIVLSGVVAISRALVLKEALKWGEVLVVALIGANLLRQPRRQRIAAWVILAAATAESLLAYGQWVFAVGDVGATGASLRVFGTFGQPNPFAAYLNLALPLALALALLARDPRVRWPAAAVAALLLGAQVLAGSRGGLLGLAAAVVVMLLVALGIERTGAVIAVGGGALLVLAWVTGILPASLRQRALHLLRLDGVSLTGPLNDSNFSSVERLAHWVAGLRMFQAHPLLGVGAGNYDPAYARYHVPGWNLSLGHAHNYYINAAAETGITGLAIFLLLTGATLYTAWRATRQANVVSGIAVLNDRSTDAVANTPPTTHGQVRTRFNTYLQARWRQVRSLATTGATFPYAIALGMLGTVVAIDVHNLVDDAFVHGIALQLGLCLALVAAILRGPEPPGVASEETASEQAASP